MDISTALQLVRNEVDRATKKYPAFASPHEGISIIEEEYPNAWKPKPYTLRLWQSVLLLT